MAKAERKKGKSRKAPEGKTVEIKADALFRERNDNVKFPRIIRVRKIDKMGATDYVFFMAENTAAMAAHPNGGFVPKDSFLLSWQPEEAS